MGVAFLSLKHTLEFFSQNLYSQSIIYFSKTRLIPFNKGSNIESETKNTRLLVDEN